MWTLEPTEEYGRRHKRYSKDHPRELTAVLDNLDTFLGALKAGAKVQHARFGFIHVEQHGVLAIDQKGGGKSLAQTRLYVYPDADTETLYILTLGDKRSQHQDIKTCNNFVAALKSEKDRGDHEHEKTVH
jgi:hypothetical protein